MNSDSNTAPSETDLFMYEYCMRHEMMFIYIQAEIQDQKRYAYVGKATLDTNPCKLWLSTSM